MENLSNLISKQVVSIEDSVCVGYILNVVIDADSFVIDGFLVADDESEKVNFLDYKNIFAINDFVVIKNLDMLSFGENVEPNNPIGKIVLSERGEIIGKVKDVVFDGKKIVKILTDKCEINSKNIANFEGEFLFFNLKKKKKKIKINFPKINNTPNINVKIQFENTKNINKQQESKNSFQLPFKVKPSIDGLLGKIAANDVFGKNNEIIARKNEIITQKIIKNAKKHAVENILFFNCK